MIYVRHSSDKMKHDKDVMLFPRLIYLIPSPVRRRCQLKETQPFTFFIVRVPWRRTSIGQTAFNVTLTWLWIIPLLQIQHRDSSSPFARNLITWLNSSCLLSFPLFFVILSTLFSVCLLAMQLSYTLIPNLS